MESSNPRVDFTSIPNGALVGLRSVDFSAVVPQVFVVNASNIASLNSDKSIRIILEAQDTVQTLSPWILNTRQLEQNSLVHVFTQAGSTLKINSPTSWQNPLNRFDADGDGSLSPLDALVVINHINRLAGNNSGSTLPVFDPAIPLGQYFVDVNGSNSCEPLDILEVINQINRASLGSGEGEGGQQFAIANVLWNNVEDIDVKDIDIDKDMFVRGQSPEVRTGFHGSMSIESEALAEPNNGPPQTVR